MIAPARTGLSGCLVTLNEEDHLAACLETVQWCDEILVVDSHSIDRTREIAADLGARVIERDWPGYVAQKEFAVRNARHDWVLCVDADERVSPALRREIITLRAAGFPGSRGWAMPRLSHHLGGWVRHGTWYPDRCLRLFDRRHGRWGGREPHAHVEIDGRPRRLTHPLLHFPYRSLAEHLETIDHYTTIVAQQRYHQGTRAALRHLVVRPWAGFLRFYVLKRGFLDGWRGLLLAYLHAHYVRMKWAKLFVLQHDGVCPHLRNPNEFSPPRHARGSGHPGWQGADGLTWIPTSAGMTDENGDRKFGATRRD